MIGSYYIQTCLGTLLSHLVQSNRDPVTDSKYECQDLEIDSGILKF